MVIGLETLLCFTFIQIVTFYLLDDLTVNGNVLVANDQSIVNMFAVQSAPSVFPYLIDSVSLVGIRVEHPFD